MKVNKNAPTFEPAYYHGDPPASRIPIRLEIATKLVAARFSNSGADRDKVSRNFKAYLHLADELIKAHNETCEE